jgi:glycosyltransferase involved in cell wall biosynthesis
MKHGVPYVLQPHASTPRQTRKHIKWLFDVVFGRAILDDAGHIIAVSKEEEEFDKHLTQNEEITVIYNGIDLVAFINPPESSVFREKYGICDFAKRRAIPKNFSLHKKIIDIAVV